MIENNLAKLCVHAKMSFIVDIENAIKRRE